ncbi:MAG: GDSL-type esterase/lipase family protein [Patescibacteria group bacterium]
MTKPTSICVFGDSTAWGAWDIEKGGWVNRLWLDVGYRDKDYVEIYNLSISGGTSKTILDRFESEAKARSADALIFQTGGNDTAYDNDTKVHQISKEKFKENLEEIIRRAKLITDKICFVGFKNADETKTLPVSWCNLCYANKDLQEYEVVMKEVCENNRILFMDLAPLENVDFHDGLHLNAVGHQKIFEQVKLSLERNKWI